MASVSPWRGVFLALAGTPVLAEWHLSSGVTFFMLMPPTEEIGSTGIPSSTASFAEIVRLVIRHEQQLGGRSRTMVNDLSLVASCLRSVPKVQLKEAPGEISVSILA